MLAGVIGFDALAGGVIGVEGVAFVPAVGEFELVLGRLAPLPAAPDVIGVSGDVGGLFELLLGFVTTTGSSLPPSDPPHAQIPSSPIATAHLDALRKYMIFLRMPWPSIRPAGGVHNEGMPLCVRRFTGEPEGSRFGAVCEFW
jgi:hypothetical protein